MPCSNSGRPAMGASQAACVRSSRSACWNVRFELAGDGAGTLLVLDHRLIDEPAGMAYMARWTRALDRLDTEIEP
jgi:hypothetical protein